MKFILFFESKYQIKYEDLEQKLKYICLIRFLVKFMKIQKLTHEEAMRVSDYEERFKLKEEIEEEIGIVSEGVEIEMEMIEKYRSSLIQWIDIEEGFGVKFISEQEKAIYMRILIIIEAIKKETNL